jgi:hypothetical protein
MESKIEYKFKPLKKTKKRPSSKSLRKTLKNKTISHHEKIIHIDAYTKILRAYHNKTRNKNKKKELMKKILKYNKKMGDLQNVMKMYPNTLYKNKSNTNSKNNEYNPRGKAQELKNKIQQFEEYKKNRDYKLNKTKNRIITILKSKSNQRQDKLSNQITTSTIQKELELFYFKHPEFRPNSQLPFNPLQRTYYPQQQTQQEHNDNYNSNQEESSIYIPGSTQKYKVSNTYEHRR